MYSRQLVSPDLLEFFYPAPQSVHLNALLAVLGLQLRDGLFLLRAVELDLLQRGTHRTKLLLQGRHVLLLLKGNKVSTDHNCNIKEKPLVETTKDSDMRRGKTFGPGSCCPVE